MLYGRDEFFQPIERHWRERLPVILAAGGHGAGKTAVLDEICRKYGNHAPLVKRDIAIDRYSVDGPGLAPGDTPLMRLLRDLKFELELRVRGNGEPIRFPRLSAALIAAATWRAGWGDDTEVTLDEARALLADKTATVARIAPRPVGDTWVGQWVNDVLAGLVGGAVPFPASVFVRATVHAFVNKALGRRRRGVPVRWHENFDPASAGDGYEALVMFARDHSAGGNLRARVERRLVAAFLADLSDAYGGPSWWSARAAPPLVLLDNVAANPVGRRFLELVVECRARDGAERDPLVAVGCVPKDFALKSALKSALVRRMELAPLRQPDVLDMLAAADPRRYPGDLDQLIVRLTGGLPLGVAVITAAVALAAPRSGGAVSGGHPGPVHGGGLLDLPVPGPDDAPGPPAAVHLLRRLMPEDSWRTTLTMLSCARDADEAQKLADTYLAKGSRGTAVPDAEQYLEVNGWAGLQPGDVSAGKGHFVPDPFLRMLLRHQLLAASRPTSAHAHAVLRDRYGEGASSGMLGSSEPPRLYHCLALGDAGYVARRLRESFKASTAHEWLSALVLAAAAPCGARPDPRRDTALGEHDDPECDDIHRSVTRLLHAAWYLHDPLVAPDGEVIGKLTRELELLAHDHPRGNRAFTNAAREWPERLREWRQDWQPQAI